MLVDSRGRTGVCPDETENVTGKYVWVTLTGVVLQTFPDDSNQIVSTIGALCTLQLRGLIASILSGQNATSSHD